MRMQPGCLLVLWRLVGMFLLKCFSKQRLVKVPWHSPSKTMQDNVNKAQKRNDSWWNMVLCIFDGLPIDNRQFWQFWIQSKAGEM